MTGREISDEMSVKEKKEEKKRRKKMGKVRAGYGLGWNSIAGGESRAMWMCEWCANEHGGPNWPHTEVCRSSINLVRSLTNLADRGINTDDGTRSTFLFFFFEGGRSRLVVSRILKYESFGVTVRQLCVSVCSSHFLLEIAAPSCNSR